MPLQHRHNVQVRGSGPATMFFAHGMGCNQTVWRHMEPSFSTRFRTVTFDMAGAERSNPAAYDAAKYSSLYGYASDVLEIVKEFGMGPTIFVGHSVSAMIGMLADLREPGLFAAHIMISPSPCHVAKGNYVGGYELEDVESMLRAMEIDYSGWASIMASALMGSPNRPELSATLTKTLRGGNIDSIKQFTRVTFLSDHREAARQLTTRTLILQSSDDFLAPLTVGSYLNEAIGPSTLKVIRNVGHCPHVSEPGASIDAIDAFLLQEGMGGKAAPESTRAPAVFDLLTLLDDAACGLLHTDKNHTIHRANKVFCDWLGYTPNELVGKHTLEDLLNPRFSLSHELQSLPQLHSQSAISEVRAELLHKNGFPVPVVLNAVQHDQDGTVNYDWAVFVAQEHEKYEQELIHSRDRLQTIVKHADLLQAEANERAQFAEKMVGVASHDLRNPLMTMLLCVQMLRQTSLTADQLVALERLTKAGSRACRLLDDLLDLTKARLGRGLAVSPVLIDLKTTVAEAVDELSHTFPDHPFVHEHHGGTSCVADADRLTQLVGNLVVNAVTYGAASAAITITSMVDLTQFSITVHNLGDPIPTTTMDNFFKLLVRGPDTSAAGHSVGLGLFIVAEIAKAHGGTVTVKSTPSGGTVFSAVFPQGAQTT